MRCMSSALLPRPSWDSDTASLPSSREELIADFANFHPDLLRVLEVTNRRDVVADLRSRAQ